MNLVGEHGKGESVWLGFFLYEVLMRFHEVARTRGDHAFAERCQRRRTELRRNLEQHGWDGEWYRRAYFDDGSPLGSSSNPECRLIRLRRAGLFFRVREIMSVRAWPWKRWMSVSFAASMG
jgi:cyclic beta-1,2-glucan synthetase